MSFLGGIMGGMAAGANTQAGADAIQGLISQGQSGIQGYYDKGIANLAPAYQGALANVGNYFTSGTGFVNPWAATGQAALGSQAAALGLPVIGSIPGPGGSSTGATGAGDVAASSNIGINRFQQDPSQNPYLVSNAGAGFNASTNPGYQFALQQGQQAINASAAARGGLLSGANLKALDAYTVGQANQNFNTYVGQQQNAAALNFANMQSAYGNVAGLTGTGLQAGQTQANLAGTGMAGSAQLGVANMGDLTSLSTAGMGGLASLYGSGISGTASLYGANTAAQSQAWQSAGQGLGNMFSMAAMMG